MRRRGRGRRRGRAVDLTRYRGVIDDWSRFQEASQRPEPTVCRLRTGRVREAELIRSLEAQGYVLRPVDGLVGFHRVVDGPRPISLTLEHWLGLVYIQQASTGVAAPLLDAAPGERVLDLCAAPGGKTTHVAELMGDRGCLVAAEIDERRIRGLLGNVYRLGHPNVLVVAADGRSLPEGALFDRVLVDAPCSGEGTLRRRSGEAPNQSRSFLEYVTRAQRELLRKAIRLTRPGGTVLYATCTFAPEENEAVVSDVLADGLVSLEPLGLGVDHAPGLTSFEGGRFDPRVVGSARIYPHHLDSGGLFLAKLRRLDVEARADPPSASARWGAVPAAFPDGSEADAGAEELVNAAVDDLRVRFGLAVPPHWGWMVRGGRVWLHTAGEWPMESWEPGPWRTVSVGIRAVDFDTRGRPRPTNDLLRLAGDAVKSGVVDVGGEELAALLQGGAVPMDFERLGPVALRNDTVVLGRGAATRDGLKSEIPKARAADLRRALD